MMGMFAGIAKFLEPIISNVYVLGTALTLLTAKMIINTTATLANSLATIKNLFTRKSSKTAITQENMAFGYEYNGRKCQYNRYWCKHNN